MALVIITIEDKLDPTTMQMGVKCTSTPQVEEMMKKNLSGNDLTAAEGYAIWVLNQLIKKSKEEGSRLGVPIPRVRGRSI